MAFGARQLNIQVVQEPIFKIGRLKKIALGTMSKSTFTLDLDALIHTPRILRTWHHPQELPNCFDHLCCQVTSPSLNDSRFDLLSSWHGLLEKNANRETRFRVHVLPTVDVCEIS